MLSEVPTVVGTSCDVEAEWNDALMLAATSHALRDLVLSHEHVMRLVLLELVPLEGSAPVSLHPQAGALSVVRPFGVCVQGNDMLVVCVC